MCQDSAIYHSSPKIHCDTGCELPPMATLTTWLKPLQQHASTYTVVTPCNHTLPPIYGTRRLYTSHYNQTNTTTHPNNRLCATQATHNTRHTDQSDTQTVQHSLNTLRTFKEVQTGHTITHHETRGVRTCACIPNTKTHMHTHGGM